VIGNGCQVSDIADDLASGTGFSAALMRHTYEPDPPIRTPRIVLAYRAGDPMATFGSALSASSHDAACWARFDVPLPPAGSGYLLTTYAAGGGAPSAQRQLLDGTMTADDLDGLADQAWNALLATVRVALAVRPLTGQPHWTTRSLSPG
jgi:hypothetical protein